MHLKEEQVALAYQMYQRRRMEHVLLETDDESFAWALRAASTDDALLGEYLGELRSGNDAMWDDILSVAAALGVEIEPHDTFRERLLEAARLAGQPATAV